MRSYAWSERWETLPLTFSVETLKTMRIPPAPIYWRDWLPLSCSGLLEVADPSQKQAEEPQWKGFSKDSEEVIVNRVAEGKGGWERGFLRLHAKASSLSGARPSAQSPQIRSLGRAICLPRAAKGDDSFPDSGGGSDPSSQVLPKWAS